MQQGLRWSWGNGTPTFLQLLQLPLQRCQFVLIHPARRKDSLSSQEGAGSPGDAIGGLQGREGIRLKRFEVKRSHRDTPCTPHVCAPPLSRVTCREPQALANPYSTRQAKAEQERQRGLGRRGKSACHQPALPNGLSSTSGTSSTVEAESRSLQATVPATVQHGLTLVVHKRTDRCFPRDYEGWNKASLANLLYRQCGCVRARSTALPVT